MAADLSGTGDPGGTGEPGGAGPRDASAGRSALERLALRCAWPGFAGGALPGWVARAMDDGMPGVVLYGANATSPTSMADLGREIARRWPHALVAVDEEGGDVTRLEYLTGSSWPGNLALGHLDDVAVTEAVGAALAEQLLAAGVTVDVAPSVDVGSDPRNPVIGTRSFGADPDLVARHGAAMVAGLQAGGVVAVPKHFPGHGATTSDSHLGPALLDVDAATLRARDLPPFAAAIEAGALAVMTGHVLVPALDDAPATLSAAHLVGLLRGELGFAGAVVTDALDMAAVARPHGIGGAAVRALAAGADVLLTGPGLGEGGGEARLDDTVAAIVAAVQDGSLDRSRLEDAAARVDALVAGAAALRERAGRRADAAGAGGGARTGGAAPAGPRPDSVRAGVDGDVPADPRPGGGPATGAADLGLGLRVARAAVTTRGVLPLSAQQRAGGLRVVELRATTNLAVGQAAWSLTEPLRALGADVEAVTATDDDLPDPAALAGAGSGRTLVLAVREARLVPEQAAWVRAVLDAATTTSPEAGPGAVLVCLGMPQDGDLAPDGVAVVAARSASAVSTRAAAEALWGG